MFSPELLELLRCPTHHTRLEIRDRALVCTHDAELFPIRDGYVEILPRAQFEHSTQYVADDGGTILDYREIGPALLSACIKNDWLNEFLNFTPNDIVLDLGCGNGKFAYWNRGKVKTMMGLDIAPWFADRARAEVLLVRGDLRALPLADGVLDKVFSVDVLEHLTRADIERVLDEAARVLKSGGLFFVFSNTREVPTLAPLMRPQRAVTRWLTSRGLVDFARDEWRKSDHVKAIRTFEELRATFESHGFRVRRVKFWNGLFQGWIENVVVKLGEGYLSRRARGHNKLEQQINARSSVRARLNGNVSSRYSLPLEAMTKLMSLDLKLFGNLRAGPYFLLVEKMS